MKKLTTVVILIALTLVMCINGTAFAYTNDNEKQTEKIEKNNEEVVDDGNDLLDADGLLVLGEKFFYADGTDQDFDIAFSYYKKAAEMGNAEARELII